MLKKMLKQRNKKGFTLIELIVVLVILAILVAAALPTMMGYVNKARKASYLANCRAAYVSGQAAITSLMGKKDTLTQATDWSTIKGEIEDMVPELKDKITETATSGMYAVTVDYAKQKITLIEYGVSSEAIYVKIEPGVGSNVMDG